MYQELFKKFMNEETPVMSFQKFCEVNEAPISFEGDYGSDFIPIQRTSLQVVKANYQEVDNIKYYTDTKDYEVYINYNGGNAFIGETDVDPISGEVRFNQYCRLLFSKYTKIDDVQDTCVKVRLVTTASDYRGIGLSYTLYASLIAGGYTIVSDNEQYQGAVALWKKMMGSNDINISFYNEKTREAFNTLPDDKIWSKDPDDTNYDIVIVASKK